jgi:hypothetical protein
MNRQTESPVRRPGPAADDPLAPGDPLLAAVGRLRDDAPQRDLWPAIAARLTPARGAADLVPFAARRRVVSLTLPQLAMAATLLMAVSAGVSWLALAPRQTAARPEPAIRAVVDPSETMRPDIQRATFADAEFDAAVADLERILRDESQRLDPQTIMVIERNLRAIDEAIRESRAALDADPANTYLNSHLADARRRKLDLLRRAAGLTTGG